MWVNLFLQKTSNLFGENRLLKFVVVVLAAMQVWSSVQVARALHYQRTILIPPNLTQAIEFVDGKPSDQYLRDLARRMVGLAVTYTPATVRGQFNEFLALYAPESYPQAFQAWYSLASRVEESQVCSFFDLQHLTVDGSGKRIEMIGEIRLFSQEHLVEKTQKKYEATYRLQDGRFYLLTFQELEQTAGGEKAWNKSGK